MVLEPLKLAARTLFFRQLVAEAVAAEMQRAAPEVTAACSGALRSNPAIGAVQLAHRAGLCTL